MRYRRSIVPGGTYFFTVNLQDRSSTLLVDHAYVLRSVVRLVRERHPFEVVAWVTLPDHLHAVLTLPEGDANFAMRWSLIKSQFSKAVPAVESTTMSRMRNGERGIWQKRFREHLIADDDDLRKHVDYVHYNPVKHGHVQRASEWPYSSMHRYVRRGLMTPDWASEA